MAILGYDFHLSLAHTHTRANITRVKVVPSNAALRDPQPINIFCSVPVPSIYFSWLGGSVSGVCALICMSIGQLELVLQVLRPLDVPTT